MATSRLCSIAGCGKPHYGHGWCDMHFRRWKRNGDPLVRVRQRGDLIKFFRDIAIPHTGDDCLIWPYTISRKGYGQITLDSKRVYVHRAICEAVNGQAPSKTHEAAHSCGNRRCCNPLHISWKTPKENQADRLLHGTHQLGTQNKMAKLNEESVRQIRSADDLSQRELAARHGVTVGAIKGIRTGKNWGWLE